MQKINQKFILNIILPAVLTIIFFITALFAGVIPYFEENMLESKREMIQELTNSAWSLLDEFDKQVADSVISKSEAQNQAVLIIKNLRYGHEMKDYFWITDMQPKMIMHPYRPDLDGTELSEYADPNGKKLFVECVKVVKRKNQGFVDYGWQHKTDSSKIVPKLSFVKGFKSWNWIIGTGIYLDDVDDEIAELEKYLIFISLGISLLIGLGLFYLVRINIISEKKKLVAYQQLKESGEKFRKLVEASTEGIIMLLGGKIVYVNRYIQKLLDYSESDFNNLNISKLINSKSKLYNLLIENDKSKIKEQLPLSIETKILANNEEEIDVIVSLSYLVFQGQEGIILAIKDISEHKKNEQELDESKIKFKSISNNIDIGVFRTLISKKGKFIEINDKAVEILGCKHKEEIYRINILDLFYDSFEKKEILNTISLGKNIKKKHIRIKRLDGEIINTQISLSVIKDNNGEITFCDGVIQDITEMKQFEDERQNIVEEMIAANMFMNKSVKSITTKAIECQMNESIQNAVIKMTESDNDALLVKTSDNEAVGIITDRDLRMRVIAPGINISEPVRTIMSSPLQSISEDSLLFEAILAMKQKKIMHLCVKNSKNRIENIINIKELSEARHQTPDLIIKKIQNSKTEKELQAAFQLIPILLKAFIENGANAKTINHINSRISDEIFIKTSEIALQIIGKAPVEFSLIVLGSVGRAEETLYTDQDNAIIFEDVDAENYKLVKNYFLNLGEKITEMLNFIGYHYCKGEIMANNSLWCLSLSEWKEKFSDWIVSPNPKEIMNSSIFFDFRNIYGNSGISDELRQFLNKRLQNKEIFFHHMAENILSIKLPISFFGNFVVESDKENKSFFDIKKVLIPIVSVARLYSLKNNVSEQNTLRRIKILFDKGVFKKEEMEILNQIYNYLTLLRIKHQLHEIYNKQTLNNFINPQNLNDIERTVLKKIFSQISDFQTKVSFDFKGVMR
ncbi:MAG: cache domain-containing protein [Bacteroidales bacterium]|nr:cache domain-containing protein [Bacteroidales bacterium]MBN2757320.1 cache domain-containing protein [Bacteroidales bacterium]